MRRWLICRLATGAESVTLPVPNHGRFLLRLEPRFGGVFSFVREAPGVVTLTDRSVIPGRELSSRARNDNQSNIESSVRTATRVGFPIGCRESKFRQKYEDEMIDKFDIHFFVGTVHKHPDAWIIVGRFYPPSRTLDDL